MGYYTALRAKMTIKPERREMIQALHDRQNEDGTWKEWGWKTLPIELYTQAVADFAILYRADSIPFGAGGSEPPGFSKTGEWYSEYDPETGVWEFACSLKNYDGEIEAFFQTVVSEIAEHVDYYESVGESWRDRIQEPHPFDPAPKYESWEDVLTKHTLEPVKENNEEQEATA